MRYRPVEIGRFFGRLFTTAGKYLGETREYFEVTSRSLGRCGHRHRTRKAAEPCLRRMKSEWSKLRSDISKAVWQRRRDAEALV